MDSVELSTAKAFDLIISFVDLAQKSGAFQLKEAALIHRAVIKLKKQEKIHDESFTDDVAKNVIVQAINAGQAKGAYNLDQAALLERAVSVYFSESPAQEKLKEPTPVQEVEDERPLRVV
jgi:hypothetical protein